MKLKMNTAGFLFCLTMLIACGPKVAEQGEWALVLKRNGKADITITRLPHDLSKPWNFQTEIDGINIDFSLQPEKGLTVFKATAATSESASLYFSLENRYGAGIPYNFNGPVKSPEIFRQSPHDVNAWITEQIAKQAIPVVALQRDSMFVVALNGSPFLYDNYTTQSFLTNEKIMALSSGDDGRTPGLQMDTVKELDIDYNKDKEQVMSPGKVESHYHAISSQKSHVFEGIIFESKSQTLNGLRKDINQQIAAHYANGKVKDYFGALSFTTAYMNIRSNETGKSRIWVVPSVEYSNTQYCRDAFWISTMLSEEHAAECLSSELNAVNNYAEYPLMAIIWAYRADRSGQRVDMAKVQAYVNAIEKRSRSSNFYSFLESDGRLDFQYWGDVMAFEKDDVVTYNQGLFALALMMAKEMGLSVMTNPDEALRSYQSLFNETLGFFPISRKKNTILGPDPLVPDLLSQLYLDKKMLTDEKVRKHYDRMVKGSKTTYGFKTVSTPTGDYLGSDQYDITGYTSQINRDHTPDGEYFRGGSFFLYDNLFLIDAYLHGIREAEDELIWRVSLDFEIGNTTFECLNTKTGNPWKPNMGWNIAIYSIWSKLVREGKAGNRLFDAIDLIANNPGSPPLKN